MFRQRCKGLTELGEYFDRCDQATLGVEAGVLGEDRHDVFDRPARPLYLFGGGGVVGVHFHALVERFEQDNTFVESDLEETRSEWRRARSNTEASVDRVGAEPGITPERLNCLTSILSSSHALVHAMMALEAGAVETHATGLPPQFQDFAHDVEFTLYFLAAALRGSPAASETLPKLRDDHTRLVQARESFPAAYEFVLIETDRLTTALNMLREQVTRYVKLDTELK